MTSIEVPRTIRAVLPSLSAVDITQQVEEQVAASGIASGIAFISAVGPEPGFVRVNEFESGFFCDLEELLARLVPLDTRRRERLLCLLLGPRTEQVPFHEGRLSLGTWQRVLLFGFGRASRADWTLTIVG